MTTNYYFTMRLQLLISFLLWAPVVSQSVCTVCENGGEMNNPNGLVTTSEGQTATCGTLAHHISQLDEGPCQAFQSLAAAPCECPGFESTTNEQTQDGEIGTAPETSQSEQLGCSICNGGEMTNPTSFTLSTRGLPISCQELADTSHTIPASSCERVQSFAKIPCGCVGGDATVSTTGEIVASFLEGHADVYECSVCGSGFISNPDGVVVNERGTSKTCSELEAYRANVPVTMCVSLQQEALNPCGCDYNQLPLGADQSPFACSVCGDGLVIANPSATVSLVAGQDEVQCGALEVNSHKFSEDQCPEIQNIARESCGCVAPEITPPAANSNGLEIEVVSQCSICGAGEMTLPGGVVTTPKGTSARCYDLDQNTKEISQSACSSIQDMVREPCGCTSSYQPPATDLLNDITPFQCSICEGGEITNPDGIVVTPEGQAAKCSALNDNSHTIPEDSCPNMQRLAYGPCGCTGSITLDNETPSDVSTGSPSATPFTCSVCANGMLVTNPDGIIDASNNVTCAEYEQESAKGRVTEEQCDVLQQTSSVTCGCHPPPQIPTPPTTQFKCEICGPNRMVGHPDAEFLLPNFLTVTCGELQQRAEANDIHEFQCRQYTPLAQQHCACIHKAYEPPPRPAYTCNICGGGRQVTNPDGVVRIPAQPERTCAELMDAATAMNTNQCYLIHPFVQGPCGCSSTEEDIAPSFGNVDHTVNTEEERGDCFSDLRDIYEMEKGIQDTSMKRLYVLCPGKTYDMGVWSEEGTITGGHPFLALRPNVIYQCGQDGSRMNDCVLRGGDFGLASYYGVFPGIHETVESVEVRGLTFQSQNMFSVLLKSAGDITFKGCAFKGNSKNTPVLLQWEEKTSEGDSTARNRRLQLDAFVEEEEASKQAALKQVVTFQDCVFRDNAIDDSSTSFPGIIENTFGSELVVKNCLFKDNTYGRANNPASTGYAIRSFGSLTLESSCFFGNEFLGHGPVLVYGAQYQAEDNYVETEQAGLPCELAALFSTGDDTAANAPKCEASDAGSCSFSQAPTSSPTVYVPEDPFGQANDREPSSPATRATIGGRFWALAAGVLSLALV